MKIVLDTNNMNAYGKQSNLNFIEDYEKKGLIEIYYGGDTIQDLIMQKTQNPIRLRKFHSKEKVFSTGIVGYSILPFLIGDSNLDDDLSLLIFREKWADIQEKIPEKNNSKIDIKLIEASIINNIEYFVTQDKQLLSKSDEIEKRYGLLIVNRETMKEILISLKKG
jgi:hypothetical protein